MNKTLKTGESYTLTQIFSGEHTKIVIPDLQRDYCWGGKGRLVNNFLENIIEKGYKKDKIKLPMGLLYGYEEPHGHIQLCDGQQRITTLFLLVGILNKECDNDFKNLLISNFEYDKDDKEPYLQYSIRENSLYFLSDLVCDFFLNKDGKLEDIKKQPWYFYDYDNDPSIQSMLYALNEIQETLQSYNYIDKRDFIRYITQDLSFMYYDVGSRSSGEETFVVINTTGEPLSPTENLKPRYVTQYPDASEQWEEWERWFWINRGKNDTADSGLLEFLRWVIMLETKDTKEFERIQESLVKQAEVNSFDYNHIINISPEIINHYFGIVKILFNEIIPLKNRALLSPEQINPQIEWLRILPLIAYIKKFPNSTNREIIRVKQYFKNIAQLNNVRKDIGRLLSQAVSIVQKMQNPDIAYIIYADNISEQLLTEEEHLKFSIFIEAENRDNIEDIFWKIQYKTDEEKDGKIWMGEILPILKWSFVDEKFNFDEFLKYNSVFYKVFNGKCGGNIDITRRALLTRELKDYPKYFRGQTNKSFGWDYNDWKVLINENTDKFKDFFREIINSNNGIETALNKMCESFPTEKPWFDFVHIPELMAYCSEKNIQWQGEEHGWVLVKGKYISGDHANVNAYKLYLEYSAMLDKFWDPNIWNLRFYQKEGSCVVFDNKHQNIAIDIKYKAAQGCYILEMFKRNSTPEIIQQELLECANNIGLQFNGERYVSNKLNRIKITDITKNIMIDLY